MTTISRSDGRPAVEFFGGVWCGQRYQPVPGADYPLELHMPHGGRTYWYRLMPHGDTLRFVHVGTCIPDGADIS